MRRLTFAEYSALDAVNWTTLKEMRRSPLHYRHAVSKDREDTDTLRVGRAAHTAVFEPDRFLLDYAVWKGGRRSGGAWQAFQQANQDKTHLRLVDYERACRIRDAVRAHPVAGQYLERGVAEAPILWMDPTTNLMCKGRLDWVSPGAIVDLKTSRNIHARPFATSIARYSYYCQLAFYRMGWQVAEGAELPCVLIAVESLPPHDVAVYRLSEDDLYAGACEVLNLLKLVAECEATDRWPGQYPVEQEIRIPAWEYPDEEDLSESGVTFSATQEG